MLTKLDRVQTYDGNKEKILCVVAAGPPLRV